MGERLHQRTGLPGEVRRTLVAAGGEVLLDRLSPGHAVWPETVSVGSLPDLAGLISAEDGDLTFLLVIADRVGADIELHRGTEDVPLQSRTVQGSAEDITKLPEGDWAQKEYQQRAENTWQANARLVAEEVRSLCRTTAPRLVLLAGDVRARTGIAEALDGLHADVVQVEAGGRAEGSSRKSLIEEIRRVAADYEAHQDQEIVGQLDRGRARGTGVATGLGPVLDALIAAEVDRLVLDLRAMREITVRPSGHPGLALPASATTADELPADQVLVAAAAATGASLTVLPRELAHGGGVSATLRF